MDNTPRSVTEANLPLVYTVDELARASSLCATTIRAEISRGNLKARKVGQRLIILREAAEEWLRNCPEV